MNVETEYTTSVPHGGTLVNRRAPEDERDERAQRAQGLHQVALGSRTLSDLEMISTGVFSPLTGFMVREDYESVVETMRLASGLVWSMPITLSVKEDEAGSVSEGDEIALTAGDGQVVATMLVEDRYSYHKEREAQLVYRTTDHEHPGVDYLNRQGDVLLGGEIDLLQPLAPRPVPHLVPEIQLPLHDPSTSSSSTLYMLSTILVDNIYAIPELCLTSRVGGFFVVLWDGDPLRALRARRCGSAGSRTEPGGMSVVSSLRL
jgi:hypothetical protein